MFGVIFNTIAVIIGSTIGRFLKKGIPEKYTDAIMKGIALCTLYIGISGALKGENTVILILSIVLGSLIGSIIDIDRYIQLAGDKLQKKFNGSSVAESFVTASLLFCVGSMTIVGSINAGLGDNEMLITKSVLDFISSIVLTVSLGPGVIFASAFVFVFQGLLAVSATLISAVLSEAAINEMICSGSVLIIGLGLNLLGITKIKTANYLPAIFMAPLLSYLFNLI